MCEDPPYDRRCFLGITASTLAGEPILARLTRAPGNYAHKRVLKHLN